MYSPRGFTGYPPRLLPSLIDGSRCLSNPEVRFTLKHVVHLLVTYHRGQLRLKPHVWSVTHVPFVPVSYTHLDVYKRQNYYILSTKI